MKRGPAIARLLLAGFWGVCCAGAREASPDAAGKSLPARAEPAGKGALDDLIQQLGDEQYSVRRRAEEELLRRGPEAYDQLKAAESSSDLEIAERARYIVQRMRVDWVRPEDPAEVRRILARYGDLPEAEREKRISRLIALKDGQGLPAACRLARLEPSPQVSRRAALGVLKRKENDSLVDDSPMVSACRHELGSSERASVVWLQLWLRELTDRRATLDDWNAAIEAEAALLDDESPETNFDILYALMERRLEMCHELGLVDETMAALMRIVALWGDGSRELRDASLGWAMQWIIQHKRWDVLDRVVQDRREQIHANRRLLYFLAGAISRAGRADEATQLADKAFEMEADAPEERADDADAVAELGFVDWAEREYERALEDLPLLSWESLKARRAWAIWLHDRENYKQAADVLGEFFQALGEDRAARRKLLEEMEGRLDLPSIEARYQYYLACHYESRQQFDRQREALEKGWQRYKDDPDILIAMYRWKGADDAFMQETRRRIHEMSQRHLSLIEEYPEVPYLYNQRAWLISNTEGDYAQAVEHSLRSLELSPEEPSYLDTLGRCYFAVGDVENAVEAQRKAVELAPHFQIMQRQLKEFEDALAARKK
jgi:tetratricopeptide (TPR) repeat protein